MASRAVAQMVQEPSRRLFTAARYTGQQRMQMIAWASRTQRAALSPLALKKGTAVPSCSRIQGSQRMTSTIPARVRALRHSR